MKPNEPPTLTIQGNQTITLVNGIKTKALHFSFLTLYPKPGTKYIHGTTPSGTLAFTNPAALLTLGQLGYDFDLIREATISKQKSHYFPLFELTKVEIIDNPFNPHNGNLGYTQLPLDRV